MITDNRLQKILLLLKKRTRLSVGELSSIFGVSEVTIRTDLTELAKQGLVVRRRGGAEIVKEEGAPRSGNGESAHGEEENRSAEIERLAAAAAELVSDGDVIFLDAGSECQALAARLRGGRNLTVITSSIAVVNALAAFPDVAVFMLGGQLQRTTMTTACDTPPAFMDHMHISRAFCTAWGVSSNEAFTEADRGEAATKRYILGKANERIVFVPAENWDSVSLATFAGFGDVDTVISTVDPADALRHTLDKSGIRFIRVPEGRCRRTGAYRLFETYRLASQGAEPYPGLPGQGKRIAFANGKREEPFCQAVERSFIEHARRAGFADRDILVFDNNYDGNTAIRNAETALGLNANVLIEFSPSVRANNIIAGKCDAAGVPILALEIPVPSAPFVGMNNWQAALLAGGLAVDKIRALPGGFGAVESVIMLQLASGSEVNLFRTEGFAAAIIDAFGDEADDRIVRLNGGNEYETAFTAICGILESMKGPGYYVMTAVNSQAMQGVLSALIDAGIWDPERFIMISHGCDELGREQIRKGMVAGSVAYFPDRYGEVLVPAACALIERAPLPPYIYIQNDNCIVTRTNIDELYPLTQKGD